LCVVRNNKNGGDKNDFVITVETQNLASLRFFNNVLLLP